ncbi:helix-turn-helix transcriptional regulator [Streptomyces sp. CBMA156]|uniref:helix-turn-helix transcriptional regulator n=1 Tax=Streptomyces sp. CBMA156 TaxID=1930280 RepID=UPI0016619341|nr:response regulator transcription factor [Streptomyces sp. CBMA156]
MRKSLTAAALPVVGEPRVRGCGHHIVGTLTGHQALVLSHLVADLTAIETAEAISGLPVGDGGIRTTPDRVREDLHSLRVQVRARTLEHLVDTACRMRLLTPPPAEPIGPLPPSALKSFRMLATGRSGEQIAEERGISLYTVRDHVRSIRYGTGTRTNAATVFRLHGVRPRILDDRCSVCTAGGAA